MSEFPVIPGCKILSVLGEGGVATVYLGIQEKLDRKVAIKVLDSKILRDDVREQRFYREAKAAAALHHSNIIQIFDTGWADDYHYIIMEYLEESLKDRMKRYPEGKVPVDTAMQIVEGIMKALDYAHFRGIYHRDIKPENIMFKQDDTPVLVDFGIARVHDSDMDLTKAGTSLGTSYYISPEQARGQNDVDGRSDIYSVGVLLFEMLTGKKPYDQGTWISIMLRHMTAPIPTLPGELSHYQPLIDRMMAKERKRRISSGAQFMRILDRIISHTTTFNSLPAEPHKQRPRRFFLWKIWKIERGMKKKNSSKPCELPEKLNGDNDRNKIIEEIAALAAIPGILKYFSKALVKAKKKFKKKISEYTGSKDIKSDPLSLTDHPEEMTEDIPGLLTAFEPNKTYHFEMTRVEDPGAECGFRWDVGKFKLKVKNYEKAVNMIFNEFLDKVEGYEVAPGRIMDEVVKSTLLNMTFNIGYTKTSNTRVMGFLKVGAKLHEK